MKTLPQLLRELEREDVSEVAVASDRLPCVKLGDKYEPVDDATRSTDEILVMLSSLGGSRHVDNLEAAPAQWSTRIDGLGLVAVQAVMRGGRLQARFVLNRAASRAVRPEPMRQEPPARSTEPMVRGADAAMRPIELAPRSVELPPRAEPASRHSDPARRPIEPVSRRSDPGRRPLDVRALGSEGLLDALFAATREVGASDLHLLGDRPVLLRVAGELQPQAGGPVDAADVEAALLAIVPERLRKGLAEDGSCDFALDRAPFGRFRVNVARQRSGYKGCFRCIPPGIPTLASLGLPPEIERATHHHQGLVLVTGPTGHGKTNTLAAIVDIINRGTTRHIITVEDPVEFVHPRERAVVSQREVGSTTRSFASALKGSLREDPDVIVVGELRDTETVRMALAASETGHLVLGTMNTPSAAKTIDRLVDLFPPADQSQVRITLAGGLHLIIGQRLLPTADGRGMTVAVELLPGSIALWNIIREGKTYQIPSLQQRGKGFGIFRLDESLADLVRAGRVTKEIALAASESPEELDAILSGKRAPAPPPEPAKKGDAQGLLGKAGQMFGKKGTP